MTSTDLRPRNVGELLDVAVTVCVRHALPLLLITAIGLVPRDLMRELDGSTSIVAAQAVIGFVMVPFSQVAAFTFLMGALNGSAPTVGDALRVGRKRAGVAIVVWLVYATMMLVAALPPLAAVFAGEVCARSSDRTIADFVPLLVLIAGVFGVAALGVIFVLFGRALISMASLAEHGHSVREALSAGRRRLHAGRSAASTLAFVLVLVIVYPGTILIALEAISPLAAAPAGGMLRVVGTAFVDVTASTLALAFVAAFVRDARIRGEGYDLQRALEAS